MKPRHGKNNNRIVSLRGYLSFLILLSAPFLLGAGKSDRLELEAHRRQIQNMPAEQQEKLKRNFAEFQKLSVEEQNVIRKLHQRLQEDARSGGNLRAVMWVYKEWLKTLSPWDREKLLQQKDPVARLELVREFKQQQEHEEWVRTLPPEKQFRLRRTKDDPLTQKRLIREFRKEQETRPSRSSIGYPHRRFPQIPSEQFEKIMELVESHITIPAEIRDRFSGITIAERHLLVLLAAMKQQRNELPSAPRKQPNREGQNVSPVPWPDDLLMEKIAEAVSDSDFQNRFQSYGEDKERRRRFLFFRIYFGFLSEWMEHHKPSEEDLQVFFKELDQSDLDKLLRLSSFDQSKKLMFLYYLKQGYQSQFHNEISELREATRPYFRFSRGRGKGPPFGGKKKGRRKPPGA